MPELGARNVPPGHKRIDPFAESPATQAANRRAVKRAFDLYSQASGGAESAASLKSIHAKGKRSIAGKPADAAEAIEISEDRDRAATADASDADRESAIRWRLLHDAGELAGA